MRKAIILVVLACCSFQLLAQTKGFRPITDKAAFKAKFSEAAKALQTIKSDFIQEKNLAVLDEKITSKGSFSFKKENKVRMEYKAPLNYLFVINKDKILVKTGGKSSTYSSKKNKLFEYINKIIVDCVQGTALDNKDFASKVSENNQYYLLNLEPLNKELKQYFSMINIFIDKKDYSVVKMEMLEPSGDNTVITFINKEINTAIPDAVFSVK